MNADSTGSGKNSRPPWSGEVIPCPQCGEKIPEFALACPYCGSRFQVTRSGYCPRCRAVGRATTAGMCEQCGAEMMDVKVEHPATADQAVAKEQAKFDVILKEAGSQTIKAIKVVRALTGLGLPEAMDLVEGAPNLVKEAVDKAEAEDIAQQLEDVGATVEIVAQGAALPPRAQPKPRPAAGPSSSEEAATTPASGPGVAAPLAWSGAPGGPPPGYREGVLGSGLMGWGRALLTLAPLGLVVLFAMQAVSRSHWVTNGANENVFLGTRGNEAYALGPVFLVLAIVTWILLGFMVKARAEGKILYRPKGLSARLWVMLALWLAGLAWYVASLSRGAGELTMQPGGYVAGALLVFGLIGAVMILIGRRGQPLVWISPGGQHMVEPTRQGTEPRERASALQVPRAAATLEAKAMAQAQGSSPPRAIERKPRSRRFWVLVASAGGAAVVAAAIVVAVLYGGGSTEEQARSLLARADVAIREAAAENLTWHYSSQQTTTMEGDAASGSLTNSMAGDVEPPQRARLTTEISATGDLTRNLPIMGRVTLANGDEGYTQEALSVDGGNNFYVRLLQEGGAYSEWVETEEKAFVIFAEGWDLSEFVSSFSEFLTELEVAGSEQVDGVKCDVIKAKADIAKLLEARKDMLAGLQNFDVDMLAEFMKDTPPQVKIWIGTDDDLPYRITMKLTVSISEGGMSQSLVMDSMENVTRYGEAVSPPIEAPSVR